MNSTLPRRSAGLWGSATGRWVRPHHQDAGRDAGAVEQVRRQADDGLDEVVVEELLADLLLRAAAEQHAVGHDGGHHAAGLADGEHVLGEHQVGLLARGRHQPQRKRSGNSMLLRV